MTNLYGRTGLVVSARNSAGRVRTPFRPRPGKQRCLVTRRGEGRERDAGRDTGTAVGTDSAIVVDAALGEQSGERVLRQKGAVAIEHIAAGQVFGAGDVSGDTIDRLNL